MPLALTNYDFSVFIHVTAVVVGFGPTFAESVMFPVAMRMSARNLPYVHRLQLVINQFFALPALVIVVATGIYQMADGNWDYGDFWVSGTLTIVAIIALLLMVTAAGVVWYQFFRAPSAPVRTAAIPSPILTTTTTVPAVLASPEGDTSAYRVATMAEGAGPPSTHFSRASWRLCCGSDGRMSPTWPKALGPGPSPQCCTPGAM